MTTGYVTDARFAVHTMSGHPENAGRLKAVQELMESSGTAAQLQLIAPVRAADEHILSVHRPKYLEILYKTESMGGAMLTADTYVLDESFETARYSAGGGIAAVDAVLRGEVENAIVATRPPGHHAEMKRGMGFCLLSNVAITARYAQQHYPDQVKKVLIVDYDVHHGNGTSDVFYEDPSVFFSSTHQSPWYPGTGAATDTGRGAGIGTTLNMPLQAGAGDDCFRALYEQVLWPAARRYEPDLMLVSAGFDAHWAESATLGQLRLSLGGYAWLTQQLKLMADELCGGRVIVIMEGGYNLTALSNGMVNAARVLLGSGELLDPLGEAPSQDPVSAVEPLIAQLRQIHSL
jgi:acetoin utilization deacetylase AcuC-like enzyme